MPETPFIFSNLVKWRLSRHFCFWFCWYLFQVYLYSFTPSPMLTAMSFWERVSINAGESLFYLLPNIFLAYSFMYVVIPKLVIPQKYLKAIISVIALIFFTGGISALVSMTIIEYLREQYFFNHPAVNANTITTTPFKVQLFLAWTSGLRGSITIGGMAAAIKLMKYFYEKQTQMLILEREKTTAELQSLKAQLHPHFLFNTLNNIYSSAQDKAPVAAEMLLELSTLLRYILYSCSASRVPLNQEINMILLYIELEKKRYGNKLEISIQTPKDYNNATIAPLIILPFIENCFKHGTSDILENPWITAQIILKDDTFTMKLINGKSKIKSTAMIGIGIENVRKRLMFIYPGNYQLDILEQEEVYVVNLVINLEADLKKLMPNSSVAA